MENMNQLKDLLKHEIKDLYSAEEQIIDALPKMIEKANNTQLKKTLQEHLRVTEKQRDRLDNILEALQEERQEQGEVFGLFKGNIKCLAMEGLISEGEKLMKEDMSPEVSDAAIIAAAQKIEHYEISSYGTARTYAEELNLNKVESLLRQTLDEEYEADDLLTELAESRVNERAISEPGSTRERGRSGSRRTLHAGKARSKSAATAKASSKSGSSSNRLRNGGGSPERSSSNSPKGKTSSGRARSSSRGKSGSR
jgi:ferritin-like metal-binding protein YciE